MKEIGRLIRDTDIIKEVDAREGDMMVQILAQTRSHIIGPLEGAPGMGMPAVAAAPSKGKGKNK
jgi:selenophosphate synthetase-related protein